MVILLVDASEFIDKQDLRLADHVISEGRALLFVLNKIDLVKDKKDFEKQILDIVKNPKKVNYRKWLISHELTWDHVADNLLRVFKRKK